MQAEEIEEVKRAIKEAEAQQDVLKKEDAKQTAAGTKIRNEVKRLEVVLANIELKRDEILKKAQLEEVSPVIRPFWPGFLLSGMVEVATLLCLRTLQLGLQPSPGGGMGGVGHVHGIFNLRGFHVLQLCFSLQGKQWAVRSRMQLLPCCDFKLEPGSKYKCTMIR